MPSTRISVGNISQYANRQTLRESLAEFISMLIFVFAGQGSVMALSKLTEHGPIMPDGLVAVALAHGFGLFVGILAAYHVSGGHVNPAVTFGLFVGGKNKITLIQLVIFWIAQLLGSIIACSLLMLATHGMHGMDITTFSLSKGVTVWNALVWEIVMTFGLVYTVYATCAIDLKRKNYESMAPLPIGLIVVANILAGGAFDGASMNPAVAFGPALVTWTWTKHWVYWIGPLIGAGLAGFIYTLFFAEE